MNPNRSKSVQCADVRPIGNAQSHITPETSTTERTLPAQTSLKALAGEVLARTLPRTLPAQSEETPRTLPAHSEDAAHIAHWCWWLAFSESEHKIVYFHPPATRAEVLAKYPRVLVVEPFEPAAAPQAEGFLSTVGKGVVK